MKVVGHADRPAARAVGAALAIVASQLVRTRVRAVPGVRLSVALTARQVQRVLERREAKRRAIRRRRIRQALLAGAVVGAAATGARRTLAGSRQ